MAENIVHTTDMVWVLNPKEAMLGSVADKGTIIANTSPSCRGRLLDQ